MSNQLIARRHAELSMDRSSLLEALENLLEAVDSMSATYGCVYGETPEHDDLYLHEKWAEGFLSERADAARAVIAKATQ